MTGGDQRWDVEMASEVGAVGLERGLPGPLDGGALTPAMPGEGLDQ